MLSPFWKGLDVLAGFDVAEWIGKATAPVARCVNLVSEESLFKDFADFFKEV